MPFPGARWRSQVSSQVRRRRRRRFDDAGLLALGVRSGALGPGALLPRLSPHGAWCLPSSRQVQSSSCAHLWLGLHFNSNPGKREKDFRGIHSGVRPRFLLESESSEAWEMGYYYFFYYYYYFN